MQWSDEVLVEWGGGRVGVERFGAVLAAVRACPGARVQVFPRGWAGVDGLRAEAEAAGVGDRVSVHHGAALRVLRGGRAA